jgi:hypothetical protein
MSSPVATISPTGSFRSDYFFDNDGHDIVIDQTDVVDGNPPPASTASSTQPSPSSNSASPAGSPAQHPSAPRRATLDGLAGLELVLLLARRHHVLYYNYSHCVCG